MISAISSTAATMAAPDPAKGAKGMETDGFSVLLGLDMTAGSKIGSPGKGLVASKAAAPDGQDPATGNDAPAMPGGNILPGLLPLAALVPLPEASRLDLAAYSATGAPAQRSPAGTKTPAAKDGIALPAIASAASATPLPVVPVAAQQFEVALPAPAKGPSPDTPGTQGTDPANAARADDSLAPSTSLISSRTAQSLTASTTTPASASRHVATDTHPQGQDQNRQSPASSTTPSPSASGSAVPHAANAAKIADSVVQTAARHDTLAVAPQPTMLAAPHADAPHAQAAPSLTSHAHGSETQDIASLVDRIAQARESASGQVVRTAVRHEDFGLVNLQFRSIDARLSIAMHSADPDFAPAVQAASAAAHTGSGDMAQTGQGPRHDAQGQPQPGATGLPGQSASHGHAQAQQQHNQQTGAHGDARSMRTNVSRHGEAQAETAAGERGGDGIYA